VSRTQEERKADTRARLLDAAAGLFAERGIDAVSVDTVAEAAGRTSGAVYAHFGSKQGLLLALLDEWAHSLMTVIAAEFALSSSVEERLRAVATNVITNPSDQTRRLLLLERELWLRAARDPEVATAMRIRARDAQEWLTRGFGTWTQQGLIAPVAPPARLATIFRALVVGLEMQHRIDPGAADADDVAAALGTVLGVEPRPRATMPGHSARPPAARRSPAAARPPAARRLEGAGPS
jgi:AcrR family transcriptional regulator